MNIESLIDILHREGCSCVIGNHGRVRIFNQRGVKDLYDILRSDPGILSGASVADKVVGKGAAALMVAGGVTEVYADVMSRPALDVLTSYNVKASCGICVPNIINRSGTGICPVESLCSPCTTAEECIPLIEKFITDNNPKQ